MKIIPSHTFVETSNPNLFRFCDRNGDWNYYWIKEGEHYSPAVNYILDTAFNKGVGFMTYLLNTNKEDAKRLLETRGEEGSRVHQAISDLIKGLTVSVDTKYLNALTQKQEHLNYEEWDALWAFVRWVEKYKPQTIGNEVTFRSKKHDYAGTYDWFGTIEIEEKKKRGKKAYLAKKRIPVLIDWKKSSGIWGDYPLQVSAYRQGIIEAQPKIKGKVIQPRKIYTAILRLNTRHKCGYEFKLWTPAESNRHFRTFLQTKGQFHYIVPSFQPFITDIPGEFKLNIPKEQPNSREVVKSKKKES